MGARGQRAAATVAGTRPVANREAEDTGDPALLRQAHLGAPLPGGAQSGTTALSPHLQIGTGSAQQLTRLGKEFQCANRLLLN